MRKVKGIKVRYLYKQNVEEDSRLSGGLQREMSWLETSYRKIIEDYLGVALIKPGDSVIVQMRGFCFESNQGGTAYNTSLFMET